MHLARFPRARFAHLPTPLEPLPRLGAELGIDLWVKRDDCTGLAGGGNKTRKLEFLLGEALAQGADTLVTQGAVQSNHVRQTIAAGARFGLASEIILEERTGSKAHDYVGNGNVLLDRLMGASIRFVPGGTDMVAELEASAQAVRQRGGKPYVIPGGGSNTVGALGYVDCARELVVQADERDLKIDRLVTATGSAGTHAGLVAGFAALSVDIPILGFGVRAPKAKQEENVFNLAVATAETIGAAGRVMREMVVADCDYVGEGYGLIDQGVIDALSLAARTEGLLLDPVYSGKAMKGLIDQARKGAFKGERVVFLHTGGAQGLFGYHTQLEPALLQDFSTMTKTLGVLGGMGPAATLDFLAKLQAATPAKSEQDHLRVLVDINPKVPDRNLSDSDPGPVLAAMAEGLRNSGAQVLAIACNTAHAFADHVRASGLPLVDMLETAGRAAKAVGAARVGVLGTGLALGLYRDRLSHQDLEVVTLDDHEQVEFMALLYRIKLGALGSDSRETMTALARRLIGKGAQAVVAGCTEVPLVLGAEDLAVPFIDATEALAKACVAACTQSGS